MRINLRNYRKAKQHLKPEDSGEHAKFIIGNSLIKIKKLLKDIGGKVLNEHQMPGLDSDMEIEVEEKAEVSK